MAVKWDVEYCPGCGAKLQLEAHPTDREALMGRGYDIYCRSCRWSGDVTPDGPLEGD